MKNKQVVLKPQWLIAIMLLTAQLSSAQLNKSIPTLDEVAFPIATKGWIDFRSGNNFDAQTVFINQKSMFGLTATDEMRQTKIKTDEIGFTHVRYQQYYNNIKIEGAECIAHHNGQSLKTINGVIVTGLALNTNPQVAETAAFTNALKVIKSQSYIWLDNELAKKISEQAQDPSLLNAPKGELVICRKNWNGQNRIIHRNLREKLCSR